MESSKTKEIRILVVEDSSVVTLDLKKKLVGLGYIVPAAVTSGEKAITEAFKIRPDIILMDIELDGELNGIEAAHEIKKELDVPIIYTTAYSDDSTIEKVKITDPFGYLIKPYDKKDLLVAIEIALRRHEFEKRLEESEKKYRGLFEKSKDAIFIKDEEGGFIDFNSSMVELFGYSEDEMKDLSLNDLAVDSDVLDKFEKEINENDYSRDFEINFRKKDGTELSCLATGNIFRDKNHEVQRYQGIIRDISEKKEAEEKLKRSFEELHEANRRITLSEEKYKFLVEGSNDIIFSLDENWRFITANKTIKTLLRIKPEDIESKSFLDLIHSGSDAGEVTKQLVEEKLESFSKDRNPVNFKAEFVSPISSEPKEMQVRLEYVNIEGKNEILGKISSVIEDALMKYFLSEKQEFIISNYLITAEDISHRLTRNVTRYHDPKEVNPLRIALREIIINSIEHGNLDISFDAKTEAILNDNYIEFIAKRQNDPEYSTKRVKVEYSIDPEKVVYTITDEGKGFDYNKILKAELNDVNEEMIPHGRGIKMAYEVFDKMEYNNKGNQVILIKKFNKK